MVSCASCGCSLTAKNKDCGVTFHSFPKNGKQKAKWIAFLKKPDFILKRSSVLCSNHFSENCFDRTSRSKVRLFPNSIPTIEVDRLKYVRTFNPMVISSVIDVENESQCHDILPSTSSQQDFFSPPLETVLVELEETQQERILKRKIDELERNNSLKSHKIRKLQKIIGRQKKQISSLKAVTMELKKKKRKGGTWNCLPLEDINILNVSSRTKPPEQIRNESLLNGLAKTDPQDDHIIDEFMRDHNYSLIYNSISL